MKKQTLKNIPLIYLASISPRRKTLLEQIGLKFEVLKIKSVDEKNKFSKKIRLKKAQKIALNNAIHKNNFAKALIKEGIIISADTLVFVKGKLLPKPSSKKNARKMLIKLSNTYHYVITGVAIIFKKNDNIVIEKNFYSTTKVYFKKLSNVEIENYLQSEEYQDKAGGYGIQGKAALFVTKINGCFYNVVGLPLSKIMEVLQKMTRRLCD